MLTAVWFEAYSVGFMLSLKLFIRCPLNDY